MFYDLATCFLIVHFVDFLTLLLLSNSRLDKFLSNFLIVIFMISHYSKRLLGVCLMLCFGSFYAFQLSAQDITHPGPGGSASFSVVAGTTVNYYDDGGPDCDGVGGIWHFII